MWSDTISPVKPDRSSLTSFFKLSGTSSKIRALLQAWRCRTIKSTHVEDVEPNKNERSQHLPTLNSTQQKHSSASFARYITRAETTFSSVGGRLRSAPSESDVSITVPSGAIPTGTKQSIFFGVICNEEQLLRDFGDTADRTLISPVIECGPHDINLLKPVEIVIPHCLYLREAKKEWISVYRSDQFSGQENVRISWEEVPNESEKSIQSKAWFTVKENFIHIWTTTFSIWSVFACGGPKIKRATVFASRPDPKSDLIYLRFYVYNDCKAAKKRVELQDRERFPDSRATKEESFKIYKDNEDIIVRLTNLEDGWKLDNTDKQIFKYEKACGDGFRCIHCCDFAVRPEDGRDVNGFCGLITFQQENHREENSIYLNPGFRPVKRQSSRQSSAGRGQVDATSGIPGPRAGGATESTPEGYSTDRDHLLFSVGSDDEPVTQDHCLCISEYIGDCWKKVLRKLSVKEASIRNHEVNYKNSEITETCYQALLVWMERVGPQVATTKRLCDALRDLGCSEALKALWEEFANTSSFSDC